MSRQHDEELYRGRLTRTQRRLCKVAQNLKKWRAALEYITMHGRRDSFSNTFTVDRGLEVE